jgi:hypothetical protein
MERKYWKNEVEEVEVVVFVARAQSISLVLSLE